MHKHPEHFSKVPINYQREGINALLAISNKFLLQLQMNSQDNLAVQMLRVILL